MSKRAVHVVGRGIVGLSTAWELACRGWQVSLVGPRARAGSATVAAVGMSSVKGQIVGQKDLFAAKLKGHDFLRTWLERLALEAGRNLPLDVSGVVEPFDDVTGYDGIRERTFHNGWSGCRRARVRTRQDLEERLGPLLGDRVQGGFHYFCDYWFDPRATLDALEDVLAQRGVRADERELLSVRAGPSGGTEIHFRDGIVLTSQVILAAGMASHDILKQSGIHGLNLEPSHGETLKGVTNLKASALLRIQKTNIVAHAGEWLAGSSAYGPSEPRPDVLQTTSLPAFLSNIAPAAQVLFGTRARFRDRCPAIGGVPLGTPGPNLWVALGFYKNGLQLGPLFAHYLANWLESGDPSGTPAALRVDRFFPRG